MVDQRKSQQIQDVWLSLGSFNFKEGEQYSVSLNNENTEGYVIVMPFRSLDYHRLGSRRIKIIT